MARVVLVEDHQVVRAGVRKLLMMHGHQIVGEGSTVAEGLALLAQLTPEVTVVDLNLGGVDVGLELLEQAVQRNPLERLVVFSMRENLHTLEAAYRAGALGYVTKSQPPTALLQALEAAVRWQFYFPAGLAEQLTPLAVRSTGSNPKEVLTAAEFALFRLLAEGLTNEDALVHLGLTEEAFTSQVTDICRKLVCERAEFMRIALRHELLPTQF